jgi:GMP synthase (glutamine-hydrolysing)
MAPPPSPITIGILEAGAVAEQLAARHGSFADACRRFLGRGDEQPAFRVYRSYLGELPASVSACDGWLITGSRYSAFDDDPWIADLAAFARAAAEARPVVGICFGHQLVAQAFGGAVERSSRGWGIGVHSYQVGRRRDWMTPALDEIALLASHQDQVTRLPDGAELLAGSDFCPYGLFQLGDNIVALQGHPEMTKAFAADNALDSLAQPTHEDEMAAWLLRFLAAPDRSR